MIENNRNNEQIYGRNDMIMLDQNNKIYGSLGLADRYVMKTEEGTRLMLSNPKLGRFDDVLTEFNIYGMSKQESTTGANLIDIDSMLNECLVKNDDGTYSILKTETNRFSKQFPVNLTAGTVVRFDADVIEYNGAHPLSLQIYFNYQTISVGRTIILDSDVTKVSIYQDDKNDVGTYTKFKNAILSIGKAQISYEPYTGGKPSPSPEYPQEIISAGNSGNIEVNVRGEISNFMITEKDENTIYEPYYEPQSLSISTSTGLPAIPVDADGNYTDANGQQWVADYVDLKRGKYVQNICDLPLKDINLKWYTWGVNANADNGTGFYVFTTEYVRVGNAKVLATICRYNIGAWGGSEIGCSASVDNSYITISLHTSDLDDASDNKKAIESFKKIVEQTDTHVLYVRAEPIERDLTPEEIEQYKKLRTKAPTTIIENNYNTWMKATYKSTESV